MKNSIRRVTAAAAISLACVGALHAHHSASMFVTTAVWAEGTVVRFDRINPHSIITVERKDGGQVRRWSVEGPAPGQLGRKGIALDFVKAGDVVRFCAFALKEEFRGRRPSQDADGVSPQFVHGHVLVTPDGRKSIWGSYGTLSECIRTSDEPRQSWLAFLDSDPQVQRVWCSERGRTVNLATASSRAFVDEITSLLSRPCE